MPTFTLITEEEKRWIEKQLQVGGDIVSEFSPRDAWNPLRLEALERAWSAWMDTRAADSEEINRAINGIGISFGELLVQSGVFEWTIATDDYGTDLAVRALPNRGDVLLFPANFVPKRWERKESNFIEQGFEAILSQVEQVRKDWDKTEK